MKLGENLKKIYIYVCIQEASVPDCVAAIVRKSRQNNLSMMCHTLKHLGLTGFLMDYKGKTAIPITTMSQLCTSCL